MNAPDASVGAAGAQGGWDRLFQVLAVVFVCAGIFHGTAFFFPAIAEPVPRWWHAMFVAINAALAVGMLRRPRWFPFVFALYVVQQVVEHAPRGLAVWHEAHRIDWASVSSIAFVPLVLWALVVDARRSARSPATAR